MQQMWVQSLGQEDTLEKEEISWTEPTELHMVHAVAKESDMT